MPRGRKSNKPVEEQIAIIDATIDELKAKRKKLIEEQEQNAVKQLLDAAKAAGKSPAELIAQLTK